VRALQQISICFCNFNCNSDIMMYLLRLMT